ncbi:MAG: GNAT family N-acetyltransferase [Candidatus Glassbacteria bacterium]|nr:GNAT family N-acetyltransferase [Candidatus Glassbacteria bacterium]
MKTLEVRKPPGKEPEILLLRLFVPETDLEPLARMLSVAEERLAGLRKTIIKGYRRFPWGFFVVSDRQGRLVANLQVGFFKPWWLVMAMGRQPLVLPALVSRILAGLGLLDKFHVANIYLEQDYRGSGLADLLMDFAESLARESWHRKKITLLVSADNLTALKLYRRRGYLETGIFRKDRIEKLEMTRSLD